jgi:hypothetical protein
MEDVKIGYESVIGAGRIRFILSDELFQINQSLIEKEKIKLLKNCNCLSFDEYLIKTYRIVQDQKYINK